MEEKTEDIKQEQVENNAEATEETTANEAAEATEPKAEPTMEEKLKEANDKYLRLYSDFENFRRRTAKEKLDLINSAGKDVIKETLPVIDDMERAIASFESTEDVATIKEGFNLVYTKLVNTMATKGLKPMNSQETTFDTDLHEAITKIPAPSDELKGKVVDVIEKGYYINDKVIRFAKVVIGE